MALKSSDGEQEAGGNAGLFQFVIDSDREGLRLDRALVQAVEAAALPLSRTRLQALIAGGSVAIDDRAALDPSAKMRAGATVTLHMPKAVPAEPQPQNIPLAIAFEDEDLLVLDKPAGLVVHPSAGHEDGTLVNALLAHCGESLSGIGGVKRPGIVHRLDKDTSGLMVVAKTDRAHAGLGAIFADHGRSGSLRREYVAFVHGVPDRARGMVEGDLGRDPHNRLRMAMVRDGRGRHAVTHWEAEHIFGQVAARVRCRLETGRTHQIRVHMTALGHPVMGDPVYGTGFRTKALQLGAAARARVAALGRQALHAEMLGFMHPVTNETLLFRSPLPADLRELERCLAEDGA